MNKNKNVSTLDTILIYTGLLMIVGGIILFVVGYEKTIIITILGFCLSAFSYFGKKLNDLSTKIDHIRGVEIIKSDEMNFALSNQLVKNVEEGGVIFATSTFFQGDADSTSKYQDLINKALERKVRYQKIICFSNEPSDERYEGWIKEFENRKKYMKKNGIPEEMFRVLHYPENMQIDILISLTRFQEPVEMIAGFSGFGRRGGLYTKDKQIISDWLNYYKETIEFKAKNYTDKILNGKIQNKSKNLLQMLSISDSKK